MAAETPAHLIFTGPTVLARAFCTLEKAGVACTIVSAPGGASPCGLAVAVGERDVAQALEVLRAAGVRPYVLAGGA